MATGVVAALASHGAAAADDAAPAPRSPAGASASREEALVELGRRLFFDPAASRIARHACSDCHAPDHGFSDPARVSADDFGPTRRHSQTLIDDGDSPLSHWDGEFGSIEDLVRGRISRDFPPDAAVPGALCTTSYGGGGTLDFPPLLLTARYGEAVRAAFGDAPVDFGSFAKAVAAYCRTIRSGESAYDRFAAGDPTAMSPAACRGFALFRGAAGCAACHRMDGPRAPFTDHEFHDTGVEWKNLLARAAIRPGDVGRAGPAGGVPGTLRAFKTPTLRDVARHAPYFHDGSARTLIDAVRHYLGRRGRDPALDARMPGLGEAGTAVADLVAFMEALTSDAQPGVAATAWSLRATKTRLVLKDMKERPLAGWPVTLVPAGDPLPGPRLEGPIHLLTDERGEIEWKPFPATHARLLFGEEWRASGGPLVPDTCRSVVLFLPVRGTARLRVQFLPGVRPPPTLVAIHETPAGPGAATPRTTLRLESIRPGEGNDAVYAAPLHLGRSSAVTVWVVTPWHEEAAYGATLRPDEVVTLGGVPSQGLASPAK